MPILFVLASIGVLTLVVYFIFRSRQTIRPAYRPTFDWPPAGPFGTTDYSLNDFVGGFVTGSMLGGTPGQVVGGQHDGSPATEHVHQAEADQPSAFGGFEAAAQHDHGSTFGHGGGFDPSPSFDAGCGFDGGTSFDGNGS